MIYTEKIARQLLDTLKNDFETFQSDLKKVWDEKADQIPDELQKAEKHLADCEAEEKSAKEAADIATQKADVAKEKVEAMAKLAADAKGRAGANPNDPKLQRRAETADKKAKDARSVFDDCEKSEDDAKHRADAAAKQAEGARKVSQEAQARLDSYQPYRISCDWLVFKSAAAIRSIELALHSRQTMAIVKSDLNLLHKEMRARSLSFFAHIKTFVHSNEDSVNNARRTFDSISEKLYLFNSVSDGNLPQQRFFQIQFAAKQAVAQFEEVNKVFNEWAQHWDYFQGAATLSEAGTLITNLKTRSQRVHEVAYAATFSCDIKSQRRSYSTLCAELTGLYEEYSEAVCLFDHLQGSPDLEPTFLPSIHSQLNRAGYFIEHALSALKLISLAEKDQPARLAEAWKLLVEETKAIARDRSALYARSQPCAQPDPCLTQIQKVGDYAQKGLSYAVVYQQDPACPSARKGQSEAISKMEMALDGVISEKETALDGVSDGGLPPQVFDKLWWAMVQINLLLSDCPDDEEKCLVTDKQLETYVKWLKTYLIGAGCNTKHLRSICDSQTAGSLLATFQTESQGGATTVNDHTMSAAQCVDRFKNSALLAARIKPLVPEGMRPSLEEIIKQAESLGQAVLASGGSPSSTLVKQLNRRLDAAKATMKATCAVALDNALGAEKEQLKALDEQLLCDSPGRQSADYQIGDMTGRSASDSAAKTKGGAAL